MAALKPAYLIHGEDHSAISERRAGLHALARREGGADCVEVLAGELATPAGVARALATMTLATGSQSGGVGRVILVEGVERWKQADVEQQLVPALAVMPPATTLALFAREEGRVKAPATLHRAVERAGGQVVGHAAVKPWQLSRWVRAQAASLGLELDAAAAGALVAQVGERQQQLLRELEKLALELGPGAGRSANPPRGASGAPRAVSAEEIEQRAARSAQQRVYALADSLLGRDGARDAVCAYLRLRQQGERLSGLTYLMAARLREALALTVRLQSGASTAEVRRTLRMPARAAERFLADVAQTEPEQLRAALAALADLELDTRGGSPLPSARSGLSALDEDTLALRALETITSREARSRRPAAV
jgi:DNA polymerase III subunit delta